MNKKYYLKEGDRASCGAVLLEWNGNDWEIVSIHRDILLEYDPTKHIQFDEKGAFIENENTNLDL